MPPAGSWGADARALNGGEPLPATLPNPTTSGAPEPTGAADPGNGGDEHQDTSNEPADDGGQPGELKIHTPDNIRELRSADGMRKLYGAQTTYAGVDFESALGPHVELPQDIKDAVAQEWREMAMDFGASVGETREFLAHAQHAAANPVSDEQAATWRQQASDQLYRTYGRDTQRVLEDTRKLIARDPRVVYLLDQSRLGDRPETVLMFARLSQQERKKGRLK